MFIGRAWKIESEGLNVILSKRRRSKKSNKDVWDVEGYYGTLAGALRGLVDIGVKDTDLKDLQTIITKVDKIEKAITLALQTLVLQKTPLHRCGGEEGGRRG